MPRNHTASGMPRFCTFAPGLPNSWAMDSQKNAPQLCLTTSLAVSCSQYSFFGYTSIHERALIAVVLAPFFVHLELLFGAGYRPEFHRHLTNEVGKEVTRIRKAQGDKKRMKDLWGALWSQCSAHSRFNCCCTTNIYCSVVNHVFYQPFSGFHWIWHSSIFSDGILTKSGFLSWLSSRIRLRQEDYQDRALYEIDMTHWA